MAGYWSKKQGSIVISQGATTFTFDDVGDDLVTGHPTSDEHDPAAGIVGERLAARHEPLGPDVHSFPSAGHRTHATSWTTAGAMLVR